MKSNYFIPVVLSLLAIFLQGCTHPVKVGTLADTGDVYSVTIPSTPKADVMVYIPVAKYEDFLTVQEHVTPDFTVVRFGAGYKHENSIEFYIVQKRSNFTKFVRRTEHLTLAEYKNNPDVVATQIYQEETTLNHHPAFYNIYTIEPVEGPGEIVIMQYIVNYQYHYANINFIAHNNAFTDPIKNRRRAIEKTFIPANEYFSSFRLTYEPLYEVEDEEEEDEKPTPARLRT